MASHPRWMETAELVARAATPNSPLLVDCRRRAAILESGRLIAGSTWREGVGTERWIGEVPPERELVFYCVHGHNVSQMAAGVARAAGHQARTLRGGIADYVAAGGATLGLDADLHLTPDPGVWVTRECPVIDRIACCWLIHRFIDPGARFVFTEAEFVLDVAQELGGRSLDVPGGDYTRVGERCSFDAMVERFDVRDPSLTVLADIIRGADTNRDDHAPECAGLRAMSLGLHTCFADDHQVLEAGFGLYDALYVWARHARGGNHRRSPAR